MFEAKFMLFLLNHPVIFFVVNLILLWSSAQCGALLRKKHHPIPLEDAHDHSLVLGATLTLLGLLIGFTLSMAVGRYDQRKSYEEEEAKAIGTEYVRADLLPAVDAVIVRSLLREYLAQRLIFYTGTRWEAVRENDPATADLQARLWAAIMPAANAEPTRAHALVVSGMNDVLNRRGYTMAAWLNRVPVAAWFLVLAIAIFSGILLGYWSKRKSRVMLLLLPIALSISFFLISDIDSPRGGVIRVRPQNLAILAESLR